MRLRLEATADELLTKRPQLQQQLTNLGALHPRLPILTDAGLLRADHAQYAASADAQRSCASCRYFQAPSACAVVDAATVEAPITEFGTYAGRIAAQGVCRFWEGGSWLDALPTLPHADVQTTNAPRALSWFGHEIRIENPVGSLRVWGPDQSTLMHVAYGEFVDVPGADGDALDVFVGPQHATATEIVRIAQAAADGTYDEDKIMLGFSSAQEAVAAYEAHYDRIGMILATVRQPISEFADWLQQQKVSKSLQVISTHMGNRAVNTGGAVGFAYGSPITTGTLSTSTAMREAMHERTQQPEWNRREVYRDDLHELAGAPLGPVVHPVTAAIPPRDEEQQHEDAAAKRKHLETQAERRAESRDKAMRPTFTITLEAE